MADVPEEAATQGQAQGCSSYSLSLPSQPPDIRNWFSSYEYESPEASELPDPGRDNGSETQAPLEDSRTAWKENHFRGQSGHEVSAIRDFVPIGKSTVEEHGVKRKQSLRELFGVGFLDGATEPESSEVLAVQRNGVDPVASCNAIGSPDAKRSQQGAIEHSKQLVDCKAINLADTREFFPNQKTEHIKLTVNCDATSLSGTEKSFLQDSTEHNKPPVKCSSTSLANTEKRSKYGIEHGILPANRHGIGLTDIKGSSGNEFGRSKPILQCEVLEETVTADGFVPIKRKEKQVVESRINKIPKPSIGRENATLQGNHSNFAQKVSAQGRTNKCPLADRTNLSEAVRTPAPELPGKWKCPRKGKPYIGPPMKQMRLEQWVRRMN